MFTISLRAARINADLSLKQVAKKTGRCAETIRNYEMDSTKMPRDLVEKLIELYEVPREYLLFGKSKVGKRWES